MSANRQIASGRASLFAEMSGSGDPVVFLHAAVADSRMWSAQMDGVSASHKAIAYDRRGFGKTRYSEEDFSSVADLTALLDAEADGRPAILVGCSQGGRIVLDAALEHPSRVSGLVLIAPNVPGTPEPANPPEIENLLAQQKQTIETGNVDQINAVKARIWLDGPLAPEGRVTGPARELLLDMNAIALRSPPTGTDIDVSEFEQAFHRLQEITMPSLVIWGDLEFPHIQERCRLVTDKLVNGSSHVLTGTAHLPSLDRPADITSLVTEFINHCSTQR